MTEEQKNNFSSALATFYKTGEESRLIELFKMFDRNGDGFIEKNELKIVMSDINVDATDGEVERMIEEADITKDGKI